MSDRPAGETQFDPIASARAVIRSAAAASLATLGADGHPFVSLVTFATLPDLSPVLWLSDLAVHTKNLSRDGRASLLMVAPGGEAGDPLAGARVTLSGNILRTEDEAATRRFDARNGAANRPGFADFHAFRMHVAGAHLVAGFGRITGLGPEALLIDLADCDGLTAGEAMIVDHMNEDHADAIVLYATVLLGLPASDWRMSGCDPEGIDLVSAAGRARYDFERRAATVTEAGGFLKQMATAARERADTA